jgi:outer membrane PBP1 activator LpoA protein
MRVTANKCMLGMLLGMLGGLCLSAHVLANNDDTKPQSEPPLIVTPITPNTPMTPVAPGNPANTPKPADLPGSSPVTAPGNTPGIDVAPPSDRVVGGRFTLLLPIKSDTFGEAAEAVRQGFLAAYEQDKAGVTVNVLETSDVPEEVVSDYTNALAVSDVMIGPLTRSCAAAIADSGAVRLPTISLAQSEVDADSDAPVTMPPLMLSMGLSAEDEARQIASWMAANKVTGKTYAISTSAPWQRRAAKAFAARQRQRGMDTSVFELGSSSGYLSAADLANLKKQAATDKPAAVFLALTTAQARQVRELIGGDAVMYGTSQLNPVSLSDRATADRLFGMNGVRLLDIPWQLEADHSAVMVYPRLVVPVDKKRSTDMDRLYALGIDAYRVARLVAMQRKQFELDGVTGKLIVGFNKNGVHFDRVEAQAIFRDGIATALDDGH